LHQRDHQAYSRRRRYKNERNALKSTCEKQSFVIRDLEIQVNRYKEDFERTKKSAHQTQTELDNKDLFIDRQASDEEIRFQFDSLFAAIKTWSTNFTGGQGVMARFDSSRMEEVLQVAPYYRSAGLGCLEDVITQQKKKRRLFVRGFAAYKMSVLLFRALGLESQRQAPPLDYWLSSKTAKSFAAIENRLHAVGENSQPVWYPSPMANPAILGSARIPQRKFHDWRALTAELLSKCTGQETNEQIQNCARAMANEVMQVVYVWAVRNEPDQLQRFEDTLFTTYLEAFKLSRVLRCQRAAWSITFPQLKLTQGSAEQPGGLNFDPVSMEDEWEGDDGWKIEDLLQQQVDLVITPALNKRGTVDGENYDEEYVVKKASVLMFVNKTKK
jgi:hypothetical protein